MDGFTQESIATFERLQNIESQKGKPNKPGAIMRK